MALNKLNNQYGATAIIESTFGTFEAPTNSDGVFPVERPNVETNYAYDGDRGNAPTGGRLQRAAPAGRSHSFDLITHAIPTTVAYSSSEKPSIDTLMRLAGFSSTLDATGGSESYTYAPVVARSAIEGGSFYVYEREQRYDVAGVLADLTITEDGVGVPIWTFACQGKSNALPTDVAVPTITYPVIDHQPPVAQNVSLSVDPAPAGSAITTLVMRSWELAINRPINPRIDQNAAAGHRGYAPGVREVMFSCTVEACDLTTWNPYSDRDTGNLIAITFDVGSTQYEKWTVNLNQVQIQDIQEGDDEANATWEIEFAAVVSAPNLQDDLTIVFD